MEVRQVTALYFSPAGTTARAARTAGTALAEALGVPFRELDVTLPRDREASCAFDAADVVLAASPTYAGKLPNKILPFWKTRLSGDHTPAIPLVLYGNRAFDNALAELTAVLSGNGFACFAAAAFVSRHAFTDALAPGRPDGADRRELESFARDAAEKLRRGDLTPVTVPGDPEAPYYIPRGMDGEPARFLKAKPRTDPLRCTRCGACARRCPMGAIDPGDVANVPGTCIKCQSCVRRCTRKAKSFDDPAFLSHVAMLERNFPDPKANLTFL